MQSKRVIGKRVLGAVSFTALFLAIITVLTLIYIPKFTGLDGQHSRGIYEEEEDSLNVLMLGSCNMYSSFSPVIAYEQTGLVSYAYCCPDQEICTAYHYLKEALKTQDNIQLVVLESLFLTCEPTSKREYYNRLALEWMRPSLNKLELIYELGAMECEYMQTVDDSAPDQVMTYAGYLFPLLRYHGREDVNWDKDVAWWWEGSNYSVLKGGIPLYSYLTNETLDFSYVLNGEEIRDTSREYFIKLQELCQQEGIELLLVKSPNHYRWDEEAITAVHEFAEERNVPLLDFHDYDDFLLSDYSSTTGRLNVYGMKKFTEHLCEYINENYDIQHTPLSEENQALWDECVELFHQTSNKKSMSIDENTIYRIKNQPTGIQLCWNRCLDCETFDVYRRAGRNEEFVKVAEAVEGGHWLDEMVQPEKGYTYYVVPTEGQYQGTPSNTKYYYFIEAPTNVTAERTDGQIVLSWDEADGKGYSLQRKRSDYLNYSALVTLDANETVYTDTEDLANGSRYEYRLRSFVELDGDTFYSGAVVVSVPPLK